MLWLLGYLWVYSVHRYNVHIYGCKYEMVY